MGFFSSNKYSGSVESLLEKGTKYLTGDGVPEDDGEAFRYFEAAAKTGNGEMYQYGYGVEVSYRKAVELYTKSCILSSRIP